MYVSMYVCIEKKKKESLLVAGVGKLRHLRTDDQVKAYITFSRSVL